MKTRWAIFAVALMGLTGVALQRASAEVAYSTGVEIRETSDFYDPLAAYGNWVQVGSYGGCWYPASVSDDWRPYTNGSWLSTDSGWYWTSKEPWAWATYHYGRWVWDTNYGWLWQPGTEWAPAWVSWREGDDYIGWAPLPPNCDFTSGGTTIYADQVVYAPNTFVFVERNHFCEPIRPSVLIVNQTIESRTSNITNIQRVNQVVFNHGPRVDGVRAYATHVLPHTQIDRLHADVSPVQHPYAAVPRQRVVNVPSQTPGHDVATPQHDFRPRPDRQSIVVDSHPRQSHDVPREMAAAQHVPDAGRNAVSKTDGRHGREIGDDSPKNGHHN